MSSHSLSSLLLQLLLLALLITPSISIGSLRSWQAWQDYPNIDLFSSFRIVIQVEHSLSSSDIVTLIVPFSIGDLSTYPLISYNALSTLDCLFDYLPFSLQPIQLSQTPRGYEYQLRFTENSPAFQASKYYVIRVYTPGQISYSQTIAKLGMLTQSTTDTSKAVFYDINYDLATLYFSQDSAYSLSLHMSDTLTPNQTPLSQNRMQLTIRSSIVESSGRFLIKLNNIRFAFPSSSVCLSVQDARFSGVVVMPKGTYTCSISASQIEITFMDQEIISQRVMAFQFDLINSNAADSTDLIVFQMEPYANIVLDRSTILTFATTSLINMQSYDLLLSFNQKPSSIVQLFRSLKEYNVFNTLQLTFIPAQSTPDTPSELTIELGHGMLNVLPKSIQQSLPQYSPLINPYCEYSLSKITCTGVGSLQAHTAYYISFKLLISYNYSIDLIPKDFLDFTLTESTSKIPIISQSLSTQVTLKIKSNLPKIIPSMAGFSSSLFSETMPAFADALGQLKTLQFDPINPSASQVLGFFAADDGSAVQINDAQNKGYVIFTSPKISTIESQQITCMSKTMTTLTGCTATTKSDSTELKFIGNKDPFQPYSDGKVALIMSKLSVTSFSQMAGQEVIDFFVSTYSGGLTETTTDFSQLVQVYLINGLVFSQGKLANQNIKAEFINLLSSSQELHIDGLNTVSFMKINTYISSKSDPMMASNFDFPLRLEIFFDGIVPLQFFTDEEIPNLEDSYEANRIQCIGDSIKCSAIPSNMYWNNSTDASFLQLSRISISFTSVDAMLAYNSKSILVPFIPDPNNVKLSIQLVLTLSHGIPDVSMTRPFIAFRQINQPISVPLRDASNDQNLVLKDQKTFKYDFQQVQLGQEVQDFRISVKYTTNSNVSGGYLLFTTLWNFTSNYAGVANHPTLNSLIPCDAIQYNITGVSVYGVLCSLIGQPQTLIQDTAISLGSIKYPYNYGIELPRSSISLSDLTGNLRGFAYLNGQSKAKPSVFMWTSIQPKILMEQSRGNELTFVISVEHSLPPQFVFQVLNPQMNFYSVTIQNGCILNDDIHIGSLLVINESMIECAFYNPDVIIQSSQLKITVLAVSVLPLEMLTAQTSSQDSMQTLSSRILTSRRVVISKANRGRKIIIQSLRQFSDIDTKISTDGLFFSQIYASSIQLSFTFQFHHKDWDDFEALSCDLSPFFKSSPSEASCWMEDLTNHKENFLSTCYFDGMILKASRNLDIKLYELSIVYSYKITITNLHPTMLMSESELNRSEVFTCSTLETSSSNTVLTLQELISSLDIFYKLFDTPPDNSSMILTKQYSYPGLIGQIQIKFVSAQASNNAPAVTSTPWQKTSILRLRFPTRYAAGLGHFDDIFSCFQNKLSIPCHVVDSRTLQIDSLSQSLAPSLNMFEFLGILDPTEESNPNERFEFIVMNSLGQVLDYFIAADISVDTSPLQTIRLLNSSLTQNQTLVVSDFYNFTFELPTQTPQKTKIILEFPVDFAKIFFNYQPDSCLLTTPGKKDISVQCVAQYNRVSVSSDVSNTFTLLPNVEYTLALLGVKNPYQSSRCNCEKVNILLFDDGVSPQKLIMLSGEGQSGGRPVILDDGQSPTSTYSSQSNSFFISVQNITLRDGMISQKIRVWLSDNTRSTKQVEFSNKFNQNIMMIPSQPILNIGEFDVYFQLALVDDNNNNEQSVAGDILFYISQFSSTQSLTIKDIPPIYVKILMNSQDVCTEEFGISLPLTHLSIPIGGFSLPIHMVLPNSHPKEYLTISTSIVELPETGISIHAGEQITLSRDQQSSFIQLRSDKSVSTINSKGIIKLELNGPNKSAFCLRSKVITYQIVEQGSSDEDQQITLIMNENSLSPNSQILEMNSPNQLNLYYALTTNYTVLMKMTLQQITQNIARGIVLERNYLQQIENQFGSWIYPGNNQQQDYFLVDLDENKIYYFKLFALTSSGHILPAESRQFQTAKNGGTLIKTTFRFQAAVSIAQQIDLACKLSQYFAIKQALLTTSTGVRCDSPSTMVDVKKYAKISGTSTASSPASSSSSGSSTAGNTIRISASDNPNPQYVSIYFSYDKNVNYSNDNHQLYQDLANTKSDILSWYSSSISTNRVFTKLLDYQPVNNVVAKLPIFDPSNIFTYEAQQSWVYFTNMTLSCSGYIWLMIDSSGLPPPNYLQIVQNLNSNSKLALANYVSFYSEISHKKVSFNVTGLSPGANYDFFFAITSDDSSYNMSNAPEIVTMTISTA